MRYFNPLVIFALMLNIQISDLISRPAIYRRAADSGKLFADKHNADLYWRALTEIAKNNRQEALKIVAAIKSDSPYEGKEIDFNDIDAFFDELFLVFVARDPQGLSNTSLFEAIGIRDHNAYLNDVSAQIRIQNFNERKLCVKLLERYAGNNLTYDQKVTYNIFSWMLNHLARGESFLFHDYVVNQMFGVLADLGGLFTRDHKLEIRQDVENYLARLAKIPTQLQQTIELMEYQQTLGIVPPAFTLERVMQSMSKTISADVTQSYFYQTLAKALNSMDLPWRDKKKYVLQAQKILQTNVLPAFQQLQDYCAELHEVAENNGVWALPDGDAYYAYMLEHHTTTNLSADEIHEIGLLEVQKITNEMRSILELVGIVDDAKEVGQMMYELQKRPEFYYPQTEEGRAQCLADFRKIVERAQKELYPLFDILPPTPVTIQAVPQHEEDGVAGAYYCGPSLDGSRPGMFYVNLRSLNEIPLFGMETLAIHEAEPGHHFQIAIQQAADMPVLRKLGEGYNAYIEGWALYTEKLAYEHKFYSSQYAQLGHLQDELMRAVRLVVDTGIHKKRWSREQAIEYMERITGMEHPSVVTEVERYFVLPGQACSYKIGQLKFLELREKAKKILGTKFDIRDFHNAVLKLGMAPLTILEEVVDGYIKEKLFC